MKWQTRSFRTIYVKGILRNEYLTGHFDLLKRTGDMELKRYYSTVGYMKNGRINKIAGDLFDHE